MAKKVVPRKKASEADEQREKPLEVIAGQSDRPLMIGGIEIPCYVLEDETRVLTQAGFSEALGRSATPSTSGADQFADTPTFLRSERLKPFIDNTLTKSPTPIKFRLPTGGKVALGYDATLLPQVCEVYLKAHDAGKLLPSQIHIADQAEILIRGLATVGIIALVDEATGYQHLREKRALATILERFIAKDLQPWTKTFPYEFYEQIFRLRGWSMPDGAKRPSVIGKYTNEYVYRHLAPGVLEELRRKNPVLPSGNRRDRHHQWFTPEHGHPKLKDHLIAVIALMRASTSWDGFKRLFSRAFPCEGQQIELPLPGED